jgi:predicted DNA-binding transcriptional regulator YafY
MMSSPEKDLAAAAAAGMPAPDAGTNAGWGNKKDAALASSWIENEGRCATLAGLALQLSLDRTQAARLLLLAAAARGESGGSKRYRATWCEAEATRTAAPAEDHDGGTEEVVPCTGTLQHPPHPPEGLRLCRCR